MSIIGLRHFSPKSPLKVTIDHPNGETESIEVNHTFTSEQIKWFQAGSALNMIAGNSKNKRSVSRKQNSVFYEDQ